MLTNTPFGVFVVRYVVVREYAESACLTTSLELLNILLRRVRVTRLGSKVDIYRVYKAISRFLGSEPNSGFRRLVCKQRDNRDKLVSEFVPLSDHPRRDSLPSFMVSKASDSR